LFSYVCMWLAPIRTWTTRELRPSLHTFMKRVHIPEGRWCLEWPKDVFTCHEHIWTWVCAHENQPNSLTKGLFLDSPSNICPDLPFQGSDVNSWPSRSPSSEHPLRSDLRAQFLRSVGYDIEMTLPHTLSLESIKKYSSLSTNNYSFLYLPPIVKTIRRE
jgi:hypothetical protein